MDSKLLITLLIILLLSLCYAYDPFTGLLQQTTPCFPIINDEGCDTEIYEVFNATTPAIGDNLHDTFFLLFTSKNQDEAEPLHKCGGKLPKNTAFNPEEETILIAHGLIDGVCRTSWMREFKTQLFIRGNYNIILCDWTWGNTFDPAGTAQNSLVAGEQASFVIQNIMKQAKISGDKFHFIGHSYGTYFVGNAGKFIREESPENLIRRITFLDPAVAPVSPEEIENGKLSKKNAKFVDAIHSNGGICFPFNLGIITPVGHADFYPNGGSVNPSCIEYGLATLLRLDLVYGLFSLIPMFCNHLQAIQYFKVSINTPEQFIGVECESYEDYLSGNCNSDNCLPAGMDAEKYFTPRDEPDKIRKFYFDTELVCPYDQTFALNNECKADESTERKLF